MTKSVEYLKIPKCPICGGMHKYKLNVERTYFFKKIEMDGGNDLRIELQPVKLTRIFICPIKNEKFQASFVLYLPSIDEINQITVGGVVEDEEEKQNR